MKYGISRYPYYHGMFKTDEYFEVYRSDNDYNDEGVGVALFGKKEDAEEYLEWRQARESGGNDAN